MEKVDAAVLTIIGEELLALAKWLRVDLTCPIHLAGSTFYRASVLSKRFQTELRIAIGCVGRANNVRASLETRALIEAFDPALIILCGIGGGMAGEVKVGDVVCPRTVVDLSETVAKNGLRVPRPNTHEPPLSVFQMTSVLSHALPVFSDGFAKRSGIDVVVPPTGTVGAPDVTDSPKFYDCALATADTLYRDGKAFAELQSYHPSIKAVDMEAGGFVMACKRSIPEKPWLVVRGISDAGNTFKDDCYHSLAAHSAAAFVLTFLEDAFNIFAIRPHEERIKQRRRAARPIPVPFQPIVTPIGPVAKPSPEKADLASSDPPPDPTHDASVLVLLENLREDWRCRRSGDVLEKVSALKLPHGWSKLDAKTKAKILRFEAGVLLTETSNVPDAEKLALNAESLCPSSENDTLHLHLKKKKDGARACFDNLEPTTSVERFNFRLSLLFELDEFDKVLRDSDCAPNGIALDAESHRLRAWAYLEKGDLAAARKEGDLAASKKPDWFAMGFLQAVVCYFESFVPDVFIDNPKQYPAPLPFDFLRCDRSALSKLRAAAKQFEALLGRGVTDRSFKMHIELWRFACAANDIEGQADARLQCVELFSLYPDQPIIRQWATMRGYTLTAKPEASSLPSQQDP